MKFMETLLQETAALEERHLRSPGTMQLYQCTHCEFSAWMAYVYGSANTGWACCDPSDVLAYLRHVVPMLHSGRGAPGQPIVASTLRKIVSALGRCFELRERGTFWHPREGGNLAKSSLVSCWTDTYSHLRRDAGDSETSAVPMNLQKMRRLLDHIEANIDAETDRLRAEPLPDGELGRLLRGHTGTPLARQAPRPGHAEPQVGPRVRLAGDRVAGAGSVDCAPVGPGGAVHCPGLQESVLAARGGARPRCARSRGG
jgi:hypothetical protein